jgi:TRAP transporter 4TM/12TM fusion protein
LECSKSNNRLISFLLGQKNINIFNIFYMAWITLHLYFTWRFPFSIDQLKVLHLGLAMSIVFFDILTRNIDESIKKLGIILYAALGLSTLILSAYFFINYEKMIGSIGFPRTIDVVLGLFFITALTITTYKKWGPIIPTLMIITMLYALFGNHLIGIFYHSGMELPRLIGYSCTYYMGTLGSLTGLSATLIVNFLIFGALLQALGGQEFIFKLSKIIGLKFKSGAAQTAVVSSAMLGMITGSTASNVAITGSLTIPMMKRRGYSSDFAGAIEAVASMGGQIMPPIMGISAFLISGLTNIPYSHIVIAAILPAIVYYLNINFAVWLRTEKISHQLVNYSDISTTKPKDLLKDHGHLLIPIIVLTWRIFVGSPGRAAFFAIFTLIIVSFVRSVIYGYFNKTLIVDIKKYVIRLSRGLVEGAKSVSKIALVLGCMGIIMEMFTVTGFGQRLSYTIVDIAGENLFILIGLVTLLTLFFGMGMPTPGAYILTVLLSAPILVKYGFPVLSVHMFVFYFAVISAITPPVAIASLVAIGISEGSFLRTSLHAIRLALPGFLLPFYFLFQPTVLGAQKDLLNALKANATILIGMLLITLFAEGYFLKKITFLVRILCLIAGVLILFPGKLFLCMGLGIILLVMSILFIQSFKKKR